MSLKSLSGLKIGNYTLPTSDGTNGQVLQTDGSGNVTFQSVSISDKFTSGLSFDTSTGVLTATVTNGSNVTEDLDGRYVLLGGDTMSGDLTITHAGSPSLHLIDTTNDVDFRLRAANSYVTFEADRDNDAGSSRMQFKIDGSLQYEILPSSTQTFADSTSFIRKDVTGSGGFGFNITTRKATGNTYTAGDDVGRINFRGRDDVVTSDISMASIIAEADNTFTSTDKKARLKFQVFTGTQLNNVLELHSSRNVEISGGTLMLGDDVTIFRDGSNILRTDDALHANGHIHVGGVSGGGSIYNRADTSNNITFSSSGVAISKDTDITGDLTINTSSTNSVGNGIVLNRPAAGTHYHGLHLSTNGTCNWSVGQNSNDSFQIYEEGLNSKTRFTIAQGGNATFAGDIAVGPKSNATVTVSESGGATTKLMGASVGRVGTYSNHNFEIVQNSSAAITIDTSKNVGIGTTSPSQKLDVNGNIQLGDSGTGGSLRFNTTDRGTFTVNGSEIMRLKSDGSVGIGTTDPQKKLDIAGGDIRLDNSKGIMFATLDANIGRVKIIGDESGDFIQMNVDNSNNHLLKLNTTGVGIGTTNPSYKLDVAGTARIAGTIHMYGAVRNYSGDFSLQNGVQDADIFFKVNDGGTTTTVMTIDGSESTVGIGTTAPTKKLDVRGDMLIAADTPVNPIGVTGLEVYNNTGQARLMIHQDDGTSNSKLSFRTGGNDTSIYVPASTYALRVDSETTTDAFTLSLAGNASFAGSVTGTSLVAPNVYAQNLYITSSGTSAVNRIDNDTSSLYITYGGTTNRALEISNSNGNATFVNDIETPGTINLPGNGNTATREILINAHGTRAKLMKEGNAAYWQVAQGSNQFEITDAANGNSTKGNVLLRTNGHDDYDNKLILVPNGGTVGINTPVPFTANANADELVVGSGSGNQGITIYSGDSNSGSIYFADDLDEEGAGDSPAGNRDGIIRYEHAYSRFNIRTGGNQDALILTNTSATFNGNISVGNALYVPNEIYHTGDTNTSIRFPAQDQFRVVTGGGTRLQVENTKILVGDDVNMQYDGISTGNSGTVVYGGFLNPASEANMVHIPHIINDLAGFNKWSNATITTSGFYQTRSGSAGSYTYSNEVSSSTAGWANAFDAHSSTAGSWYSDNGSDGVYTHGTDTPGVVELQWTNEATYSLWAGIVFGSGSFTATYVKIEAYRGGAWQTLCEITNNTDQVILRQVGSNSGTGAATTRLKYTLGGSVNNSYFRIHSLYMANYRAGDNNLNNTSIDSTRGVNFLERYKNNYAHGHFYPGANNTYDLGSSSYKWNNVNAVTLNGNLVGTIHSNTTANTQSQGNNSTKVATTAYVDTAVSNLVDSAPGTLNTLNELAAALGDDANFSTTVTNSIAGKVSKSGDTMTGSLTIGSDASGHDFLVYGSATGEKMLWDTSESRLVINHDTDDFGVGIFTVGSAQMTQPQLKVGRDASQYWGVYTDDRNAHLIHRQDETSGAMNTKFQQWDSNTSDNTGTWQWQSGDGTGANMTTAAVLYQDGDFTVKGDLMPINDGGGSLGGGSGINLRWSGLELQSGAGIQWQNGDARIVEGLVNNYSLSFQTYDGSALSTALRLDGDNTATFEGDVILNGTAPTLRIQDSRNLNNGDWDNVSLGNIEFYTSDTTSPGARVLAEVEAFSNAAAASGPNAELRFKTSQNTDSSPQTRLTISHDGSSTFSGQTIINQPGDNLGLRINGYDDEAGSTIQLKMDASGHARLSQTTDGSSGYLFLQAQNYLQLIAGTFTYTTSPIRIYDDTQIQFGSGGDYHLSYNSSADELRLMEASTGTKGLKMDTDGKVTFTEDATFEGSLYIPDSIYHVGDTNSYFGFDDGNDTFRVVLGGGEKLQINTSRSRFNGHIYVAADSTYDIGQNATRFRDLYVDEIDGGNSKLLTSDANNYFRINTSGGSAQLGLFRTTSGTIGGGYIGIDVNKFRIYNDSFSEKFSVGISTGDVNTKGHVILSDGKYLEFSAMGKLINMDVSSWSSGQDEHNILYSGWTSSTGDYLSLKVAGNSPSGHGNLIIGDNGLWFGRANVTDNAAATDSNTNPHSGSGSNYFRVNTAGDMQVSGSVISPIYYDTSGTTYYLDLGNTSNSLTIPGIISMADNKAVSWSGGSIRAEGNTLKLVASTLIDLQDDTQVQGNLNLVGDDRILSLAGGTTNSQSRVIIGEQGVYGVSFRWNSGSDLEFDGFWNSSVTGSRNRDLGSVDVNNRRWNFENTVVVGGSVTAGSFVKSGGTSSQFLMADGSVSTGGGTIDGSGAANRLAIWSDSDTLTSNVNITVSSGQLNLGNGLLVEDNDTTVITAKAYEPHIVWQKTRGSSGDDFFKIKAENDAMVVDFTAARDGGSDTRVLRIDNNNRFIFSTDGQYNVLHTSLMSVYGRLTSSADIRSTQYYDYNDTTKYIDLNSTGTSLVANGSATFGSTINVLSDGSNGHTNSRIVLNSTQSNARGAGVFMHNTNDDQEFYMGVPYAQSFDKFMIAHKSTASHTDSTAEFANALMSIDTSGNATFSGNVTLPGIVLDGNTITGVDDSGEFTDNDAHIMTSAAVRDKFGFAYFQVISSSDTYNDYFTRGGYRFQGASNGPTTSHTTGFSIAEDSGGYGWQMVASGSADNSEQLYYRYKAAASSTPQNWQTIVTKTLADNRYLKLSGGQVTGNLTVTGTFNAGRTTIESGSDNILTLNQTGTDTGWNYIDFKTAGDRKWFIGMDSNKNFDLYNDNINAYAITVDYATNAIALLDDVSITGNLTVNGTTTTVNQTNLDVSDNIIGLNRGASSNANDSGLIIERGSTGDNAAFLWDETADKFIFGTTTATPASTGNVSFTAAAFGGKGLWTTTSAVTHWGPGVDGTAYGTLTWDTGYAAVHANGSNVLRLGSGSDTDAVIIDGSDMSIAGDLTVNGTDGIKVQRASNTGNAIRLYTENDGSQIADSFSANTSKSYIYFDARSSSNDPGYIMHETSSTEANEGVLHLVPSDDNSTGDYVSIHGTNDPDVLKLHTSGLIETVNLQLQLKSGLNQIYLNDDIAVSGTSNLQQNVTVGGTSGSSGNALQVNRGSDGANAFRVQNSGEVVTSANYFYAAASGTSMYVQNTAVFRGSIINDSADAPVRINDTLKVDNDANIHGNLYLHNVDTNTTSETSALVVNGSTKEVEKRELGTGAFANVDTTYEFDFSTQLSANTWTDTGIDGTDMETGTYIMRVEVDDHNIGGGHFSEAYSATINWYAGGTNSTMHDEIPVHRSGHAPNNSDLQFRTLRHSNGGDDLVLQVKINTAYSAAPNQTDDGKKFKFKFRKMI